MFLFLFYFNHSVPCLFTSFCLDSSAVFTMFVCHGDMEFSIQGLLQH